MRRWGQHGVTTPVASAWEDDTGPLPDPVDRVTVQLLRVHDGPASISRLQGAAGGARFGGQEVNIKHCHRAVLPARHQPAARGVEVKVHALVRRGHPRQEEQLAKRAEIKALCRPRP